MTRRRLVGAAVRASRRSWAPAFVAPPYVHGLSFVVRAADLQGTCAAARRPRRDTRRREREIADSDGPARPLRARALRDRAAAHAGRRCSCRACIPAGIDEPRLVALGAGPRRPAGSPSSRPTSRSCRASRSRRRSPIAIEAGRRVAVLAVERGRCGRRDGRIGMIGISFSGGLAVVAAGRPSLPDRVAFVLSFGGHGDLPRVLRYLCTGVGSRAPRQLATRLQARDRRRRSGDAIVARRRTTTASRVMLLGVADRVVPPAQVERAARGGPALPAGVGTSTASTSRRPSASSRRCDELARQAAGAVGDAAAATSTIATSCTSARGCCRYVSAYGGDPALSPREVAEAVGAGVPAARHRRQRDPAGRVRISRRRASRPRRRCGCCSRGLISHADGRSAPPHVSEVMKLAGFWGDLLSR